MKKSLDWVVLRELLHYDPNTGLFTWSQGQRAGRAAGSDNGQGYLELWVCGVKVRLHRLAFFYMLRRWPSAEVDHVNGVRSDNKWTNLRELTGKENTQNQRQAHKGSCTGLLGVRAFKNRFRAVISVDGKRVYLGTYQTASGAHEAYVQAKRKFHPSCTI